MKDRFIFANGPVHAQEYWVAKLTFRLRSPSGLSTPDISQRIRALVEPFELVLNVIEKTDTTIITQSFMMGQPTEEIKFPLSQVVEEKISAEVNYFRQVYYEVQKQKEDQGEKTPPSAMQIDGILLLFLLGLFGDS